MTGKQPATRDASVTSMTVEVKTLMIGARQVTQSLFRQLIEAPYVNHDGTTNGNPWGTVNYHQNVDCSTRTIVIADEWMAKKPKTTTEPVEHLHVVWEGSGNLFRAAVPEPDHPPFGPEIATAYLQGAYCGSDHQMPTWARRRALAFPGPTEMSYAWRTGDLLIACPSDDFSPAEARNHRCPSAQERAETEEFYRHQVKEEKARRTLHQHVWDSLRALPQLFI